MNEHSSQQLLFDVLQPDFDLGAALEQTVENGYLFASDTITKEACESMVLESEGLSLMPSDQKPINPGTSHQVTQAHERSYLPISADYVPVATFVADSLILRVQSLRASYPELSSWRPTEAGYQRYRAGEGHISPHRDRATDQLLAVTITLSGSAPVKIYEPLGDPDDYSDLRQVDRFQTEPGSVMLLKASGFGDGQQTIHEVLPPARGNRLVLNLRMRPDVLDS